VKQQGVLIELIRLLAPARVLEIGTYFGNTARKMAEAIAGCGGSLITIDPYGGDRIPAIIEAWPQSVRDVVTFHPLNSMTFFASLEVAQVGAGKDDAPFDLVFVDGHHSFEYAYFDLMSSALNVRPGGAIVMDNMEQAGPDAAVEAFLQRFKHWRLFVLEGHELGPTLKESVPETNGAVLLAPLGVEVGRLPLKAHLYKITSTRIEAVEIPLLPTEASGSLRVTANLYSFPYDLHVTGKGAVSKVGVSTVDLHPGERRVRVTFAPAIEIVPAMEAAYTNVEIELSFRAATEISEHPVLDPNCEITIVG
jgi:predicted O-methyltransferase YrrM